MPAHKSPYQSSPLVAQYRRLWIDAHRFSGITDNSWRPTASGNNVEYLWYPDEATVAVEEAIDFAVVWSSDQANATDTITWRILYAELTIETTAATTAPSTALDTVIVADTNVATADAIQQTANGTIDGGTLTAGRPIKLRLNANAVSGTDLANDVVNVYGILVRYRPRAL